MKTPRRWLAALAGIAAAALGLGVSEAIAGLLSGATSLVDSVGQVVIDLQPAGAKDLVVQIFGTNDKLALEIVVALVALLLGSVLGAIAVRRPMLAAAGFVAFGVVAFVAAIGQPNAVPAIVAIQVAASVAVAIQTLSWLLGWLRREPAPPAYSDPGRRSFLLRTAAVGVGALAAGAFGRTTVTSATSSPTPSTPLPPPVEVVPPLAATADLAPSTPGLTPIVIPNDAFYRIDTALMVPSVDTATWQLRIHGLVERETTLSWDQLLSQPMFEQYCTIACVSNEVGGHLVGNTKWTGVRLRDVLDMAGPSSSATQLVGRSVDGWTAGMPMSWVMDPSREPMIAVAMGGAPLPRQHGYPARLIVPGLFGYVSATKWLTELELTTWESFDGYWVPLGWAKEGPILTQSRIDTPSGSIDAGAVPIAGVAWAPDRGISKVEIGIDDVWYTATLSTPISDATWVQWVHRWDATPGQHRLTVRATDGTGVLQDMNHSRPAPDGARGWDSILVNVT
ncbi:MAG TPA: molybdopterin-dependent oxidoreductase [Candidatus Limnocylindrales bacterium]|nr:molybdopterin-dependent oxidoreductase [Candidatus Limnocylindrales bacterium]